MRRLLVVAAFAVWMHAQAIFAQTLDVPAWTPQGKRIVATIKGLPDGSRVYWQTGVTGDVLGVGPGRATLWGTTGVQTDLLALIIPKDDGEPFPLKGKYGVEGTQPPQPPAPVKTLAEWAGKDAPVLAKIYASLIKDVPSVTSVAAFRQFEKAVLAELGLENNGAAAEIDKRLAVETLDQLKAALEGIVKELGSGPAPPVTPPGPTDPVTSATYIYEKDNGGVPFGVHAALSELNSSTLRATTFEEDTTDSSGDVPDQYKAPLAAAREAGLPALVVMAGEKVRRVVKAPTTREQVINAVNGP
jgi:hypothetical protein